MGEPSVETSWTDQRFDQAQGLISGEESFNHIPVPTGDNPMGDLPLEPFLIQMRVSGFCILENIIPADQCAAIRQSVLETVQRERLNYSTGRKAAQMKVGFTPSIINHDQSFAKYLADERLLSLVGRLLGPHIRISFTSAIINERDNQRGGWHADWPFNQNSAGHIEVPYPDTIMHITTLWMLSTFEADNGGTLVLPGSHRSRTNPTAADGPDPEGTFAGECNAVGSAGSVLVMDSRLWHATAPNRTDEPRVALAVRYAPWWLHLEVLRPESDERRRMCDEAGATENIVPSIRRDVYERLPTKVQPLYRHWVAD